MNKLEKLHVKPFDVINPFSPYDIYRDCQRAKNNDLMAKKSAEITTDIAIKFGKFIDNSSFTYYDEEDIWSSIATEEKKTSEKLFEEFINNHYGK